MPWRKTRDPYCIWVSEIMLQQTQVATVVPYYERFLKRFPTVQALADASLDDVLPLWAGLGYYSRARNLHAGARAVAGRFGGAVPQSASEIRQIPGIGAYTAGAILSIAYGLREPLVDGNVARVFSRLFLMKGDYRRGAGKDAVWGVARELAASAAKASHPGDLNQALMELGATVCTPRNPQCARCPLAQFCQAREKSVQEQYPEARASRAVPAWHLRAWVVRDASGRILFAQRAPKGLFGGLWEVPTERIAGRSRAVPEAKCFTHVLSHRKLLVEVCEAALCNDPARWADPGEFPCWSGGYLRYQWLDETSARAGERAGMASTQRKVLRCAAGEAQSGRKQNGCGNERQYAGGFKPSRRDSARGGQTASGILRENPRQA